MRLNGAALALAMAVTACGATDASLAPPGVAMDTLAVTSRSFASSGAIPVDYTCDGANRSPQLTWSAPPAGTQAFAVVVEDPDAPGGTFTHWIAYNISGDARSLPEGVDVAATAGALGRNDFKHPSYDGPCPPQFEIHHYVFRVYALNAPLHIAPEPTRGDFDSALHGHVLGAGALVGAFSH